MKSRKETISEYTEALDQLSIGMRQRAWSSEKRPMVNILSDFLQEAATDLKYAEDQRETKKRRYERQRKRIDYERRKAKKARELHG